MSHLSNSIHFVQNILADLGVPILAVCIGTAVGVVVATRQLRWWMFPLAAALTGFGLFILSMPLWLDKQDGSPLAGFVLIYLVPTVMVGLVTRADWRRSAVAGLIAALTMVGFLGGWYLSTR